MFNNSWIAIALFIAVAALVTGQPALLVVAALLGTVIPVAWLWNRYALHRVVYTRTLSETRAFVGERVTMTLALTNNKPLPLAWVRVDDIVPEEALPEGRELSPSTITGTKVLVSIASLSWYERVFWEYAIPCTQRGFFFFGPAELKASDIFGLFEQQAPAPTRNLLIVYPEIEPLEQLGLPAKDPFGLRRAPQRLFEDPSRTVGIRDYHPEDPLRSVHWKATARTQALQVRLWEPTEAHNLMIFLNVATFERHWEGIRRDLLEQTISVAASIASHTFEEKQMVGLIANAAIPQSDQPVKVPASRSPDQLRAILEALAAVTSFPTSPIESILTNESGRLPWGATLVVVTSVVSEPLRAALLRLRGAGRRLALVSLDEGFTPAAAAQLPGIIVHHIPPRQAVPLLDDRPLLSGDIQPGRAEAARPIPDLAHPSEGPPMPDGPPDPDAPFKPRPARGRPIPPVPTRR